MNSPIAIIDARSPQKAIDKLSEQFRVIPFLTEDITYDAIAGHPDIFFCQGDTLVVAPNLPNAILKELESNSYTVGETPVGSDVINSTSYNCVVTKSYIIHKQGHTDKQILRTNERKNYISVNQAYTRCNLIAISEGAFITSDANIQKNLESNNCECLFVSPRGIELPPYQYGFIGGCMGKHGKTIYINGSLANHSEGKAIENFIHKHRLDIMELHDGNLYDGGGILFIQQ